MRDKICKQRAWQSICYMSVECFPLAVLNVLCWSNYVWSKFQQWLWWVFLASVVCRSCYCGFSISWSIMSGCNRWAHVWIHVWSRSRPASQGGQRSWAGRGGWWLWQDLEENFPESQGQEHLGLRCSDWPATRPWGPRSARCCCWRSRLEHRRYIAYCPRTETADWPSASPRCHCAKSVQIKLQIYTKCVHTPKNAALFMQGKVLRKFCMQKNTMPLQSIPLKRSVNYWEEHLGEKERT